jgi:hypothetical protein
MSQLSLRKNTTTYKYVYYRRITIRHLLRLKKDSYVIEKDLYIRPTVEINSILPIFKL